jgi:5-methylcytosine-specific restriction enzyme B
MPLITERHHQLLLKWGGQQYDMNNQDHVAARIELREAWVATEAWAIRVQEKLLPSGSVEIRRMPLLRQRFVNHTWARIYPSQGSPRWIAYTVGINTNYGYIVKIDLVNRQIDAQHKDRMRVAYNEKYGAFDRSPIAAVLPKEMGLRMNMDELVNWSVTSIERFRPSYSQLSSNPSQL